MKKVYLYIFLTAFLFGTMEVALKLAGSELDPLQLTFLRFFISGVLLLPFAVFEVKKSKTVISIKDLAYLFLLGIICVPVCMVSFQLGISNSNASTAAVLFSSNPIFTMIFAHFLAGEGFTKRKGIVVIIGILGILIMTRPWGLQEGNSVSGILYSIIAAATFGLYTVMGKKSTKKVGLITQTSISFVLGSAVLLAIIAIMGRPITVGIGDNILIVIYASIFVTACGYFFYFMAIKGSNATTGSVAFFLKIVIAPIMAVIVLGDRLLWNTYLGIALMLTASYMNIKKMSWQSRVEEKESRR